MSLAPSLLDAVSDRIVPADDAPGALALGTPAYVRARLRWSDSTLTERLDAGELRRIHGLSGGIPRQVHRVAASVLAPGADEHARDLDRKRRREDWMGTPIEDDL